MVICLERDADLHMAQLMPLPLTVSCFSKIQICFTFLVPAHPGGPGKGPLNARACVCPAKGGSVLIRYKSTIIWSRPHCIHAVYRCGLLLLTLHDLYICPSVCLLVTVVSPAQTAKPIDVLFGVRTWGRPKEPWRGPDPEGKNTFVGSIRRLFGIGGITATAIQPFVVVLQQLVSIFGGGGLPTKKFDDSESVRFY